MVIAGNEEGAKWAQALLTSCMNHGWLHGFFSENWKHIMTISKKGKAAGEKSQF